MQRLWDLAHALEVRSKRMGRTRGVTVLQLLVIRVLGRAPDSTASEISAALGMDPSTLTGVLKRLETQRMIHRKADRADRRRARFQLTSGGRAIDRERRGTVEAAVRRTLNRRDAGAIEATLETLELLTSELIRSDGA
ncbi:hypothetical protein BH11MYX3_BH11MYX3_18980 [soil metagenome]